MNQAAKEIKVETEGKDKENQPKVSSPSEQTLSTLY